MEKVITVRTSKHDYDKVMGFIRPYSNGFIRIVLKEDYNDIIVAVSWFKLRRCMADINLAKALGINIEVIKEES